MSDANPQLPDDSDQVGKTSAESQVPSQSARERLRQGLSSGLTFYEFLLLASFIFVALACIQMFLNAREFGSWPLVNPMKTDEAFIGS